MCVCLTCVCPAVSFKVGALCVDFVAASKVTAVDSPLLQHIRRLNGQWVLPIGVDYY